ncbi:MAG TPA: hypothetical protein VJU87_12545 [Gemmatimonadaceae bacterium]|nr:hypothetical protein [Gemmatimonadaceae bacterium]
MESSPRIVQINDQRWVVRTVRRVHERTPQSLSLRFFNGAESRYVSDFPEDWPNLEESDLTGLFQRAMPRS